MDTKVIYIPRIVREENFLLKPADQPHKSIECDERMASFLVRRRRSERAKGNGDCNFRQSGQRLNKTCCEDDEEHQLFTQLLTRFK